jgi:hypothetical protein
VISRCAIQVRNRAVRPPAKIHVHVVFDTADCVEHALLCTHDTAHEGIEVLGDVWCDPRCAALDREHDVKQQLGIRACHRLFFAPPGRNRRDRCRGFHPWLQSYAPSGRSRRCWGEQVRCLQRGKSDAFDWSRRRLFRQFMLQVGADVRLLSPRCPSFAPNFLTPARRAGHLLPVKNGEKNRVPHCFVSTTKSVPLPVSVLMP